jgi:type IV pilus assembly protein PilQ
MKNTIIHRVSLFLSGLLVSMPVWAATQLLSVDVLKDDGSEQVVVLNFSETVPNSSNFAMTSPPRVAFDFLATNNALKNAKIPLSGLLAEANAIEANGRTRLVFTLNKLANYTTQKKSNQFLITFKSAQFNSDAGVVTPLDVDNKNSLASNAVDVIKKLTFSRGGEGEGKLTVAISGNNQPTVKRAGSQLVLDFPKVTLSKDIVETVDVDDKGTPVQRYTLTNGGGNVRVVLANRGDWEFSSYQTKTEFVLDVRPLEYQRVAKKTSDMGNSSVQNTTFKTETVKPVTYKGKRLSLNFQDVDIRDLLQIIAEFTDNNMVINDNVTGKVSVRLMNVPWDQALEVVMNLKALGKIQNGNVIHVLPLADISTVESTKLNGPIQAEIFQIRYRTVDEIYKAIEKFVLDGKTQQGNTSSDYTVISDPRTNRLIVRARPHVLAEIRNIVPVLDTPSRQVMIEARIVEANDGFSKELGAKLNFGKMSSNGNFATWGTGSFPGTSNSFQITQGGESQEGATVGDGPSGGIIGTIPLVSATGGGGALGFLYANAGALIGLEIQAMQAQGKGKLVSSPRILTGDRSKATIKEGVQIPYLNRGTDGEASVEFKDAVLLLDVTPQITPEGQIIMDLNISKDSVNQGVSVGDQPSINTRALSTQVRVDNAGTVVIGGVYVEENGVTDSKIPLLGDIPVLGYLFKSKKTTSSRRELIIFITPKIVEDTSTYAKYSNN